jgi:hypothetical protein
MNLGVHNSQMNICGEDADIEPGRAEFIRASIAKWERERLDEEAKNL